MLATDFKKKNIQTVCLLKFVCKSNSFAMCQKNNRNVKCVMIVRCGISMTLVRTSTGVLHALLQPYRFASPTPATAARLLATSCSWYCSFPGRSGARWSGAGWICANQRIPSSHAVFGNVSQLVIRKWFIIGAQCRRIFIVRRWSVHIFGRFLYPHFYDYSDQSKSNI